MARLAEDVWKQANASTTPWTEGSALEIVMLIRGLQVGDHVRIKSAAGFRDADPQRLFIIEEDTRDSDIHPDTWLARTGPSPDDDWGVWIKSEQVIAWRPKETT